MRSTSSQAVPWSHTQIYSSYFYLYETFIRIHNHRIIIVYRQSAFSPSQCVHSIWWIIFPGICFILQSWKTYGSLLKIHAAGRIVRSSPQFKRGFASPPSSDSKSRIHLSNSFLFDCFQSTKRQSGQCCYSCVGVSNKVFYNKAGGGAVRKQWGGG